MLISDLMSANIICCTKDQTLREVLPKFFQTTSNILSVVDDSNKLIGIITKNKMFQLLINQPSLDLTIDHFYNNKPIFLHPTDGLEETRKHLLQHNVGHAPVVNDELHPIGVVSTQQLLWSYNLVYSQLSSVLDFAYDAIILVNKQAVVTKVNKGFTELFGLTSKDVLNKSTTDLFPDLGIETAMKTGISIHNTPHIIAGQQSLISILPIKENGETISAICKVTYRGLTHLHEALTKVKTLEKRLTYYQNEINEMKGTKYTLFDIAGESAAIRQVKHEANLASKTMSTVLIIGESGTGKELFAQGIHAASNQHGPFVQVNCAAIPPELLESEFFGYADGAFTGAKKGGMKGKFELAQNGTIFLDEIGDMSLPLQTKILRVLQEKEFQPIGSSKTIHLNTKIIAATNQNIENLVADGKFRADLYYRLNIMRLDIPPLRDRIEDLPDIIQTIIHRLNQSGFYIKGITHSALTQLMQHSWPGNVRELQNVLERAANLKSGDYIDSVDLPIFSQTNVEKVLIQKSSSSYKDKLHSTEKDMIISALKEANGNKTKASQLLGISRPWLYSKIKQYQIQY
ncbi:sigma 54-interacting transcriptional regulator [Bacillus sp. DNRA2]|uniref:sigma 54-interacting transcriptional regulator n=1 Tax=Bacillus sp. DNRA2 TaxID=2723053 RepID=UPI00145E9070|nr:sigma 54-interacting transcriptional regulator [Bacillus sp. DNRA2]